MSKLARKLLTAPSPALGPAWKSSNQTAGASKPKKVAPGSKQSRIIAMLQSPNGTSIAAMMKVTAWQQNSVRGFLAGVVRKKLKLKLGSKIIGDKRIYQIAGNGSSKSGSRTSKRGPF